MTQYQNTALPLLLLLEMRSISIPMVLPNVWWVENDRHRAQLIDR